MNTATDELEPFSLTYVVFPTSSGLIGELLALLSLAPIFVMVSYATLVASRRDLGTMALVLGQLLNEVLNYVLKHAVKASRPFEGLHHHSPQYGWPSNHAQFVGFAAAYVVIWAYRRWYVAAVWRHLASLCVLGLAACVCASRVLLRYHSLEQVLAGAVIGALAAAAWFGAVELVLRPLFPAIARSSLARFLLVRDCSRVNTVQAEYAAVQDGRDKGR